MYNAAINDHLLTSDTRERDSLKKYHNYIQLHVECFVWSLEPALLGSSSLTYPVNNYDRKEKRQQSSFLLLFEFEHETTPSFLANAALASSSARMGHPPLFELSPLRRVYNSATKDHFVFVQSSPYNLEYRTDSFEGVIGLLSVVVGQNSNCPQLRPLLQWSYPSDGGATVSFCFHSIFSTSALLDYFCIILGVLCNDSL